MLNSEGKELFTEYESIKEIKLKSVASDLTYEKSVLQYEKDGLYGLISFTGKIITKPEYNSIENLRPTEGKFLVTKDGKYGCIDLNGNVLVETKYDKIESDEYYTEEEEYKRSGFIVSNRQVNGYKSGYLDFEGKSILEEKYNQITRIPQKELYLIVSENGRYGLYKGNKQILKSEYQDISYEEKDEILIVEKNKKYGVASIDGNIIIDTNYDKIEARGMYLYLETGDNKYVYDVNGKQVDVDYNRYIYETGNKKYRITTFLDNDVIYYGVIDNTGKTVIDEKYKYIEYIFGNYFIVTDENEKLGIIDDSGKTILEMKYKSLQKLKGKNIIQGVVEESGITEIYSGNMEKVFEAEQPNIQIQEEYIIISHNGETIYLDTDGNKIQDSTKLKQTILPEKIGEYTRKQETIEDIYYSK